MADEKKVTDEEEREPSEVDEITLGEETVPKETSVMKDLRTRHRDQKRRITELENKLEINTANPVEIGPKPTLEDSDFDNNKHGKKLDAWYEKKHEADRAKDKAEAEIKQRNETWQKKLDVHGEKASALSVQDYEDKEDIVKEMFDETQQGLIIDGAENSAVVVYALGKYPETAKKLAAIKNPVKFVAEMSRLEATMTVSKRTPANAPETRVKGSGGDLATGDTELDKLRAEAKETNDYSKVAEYKKRMREKK